MRNFVTMPLGKAALACSLLSAGAVWSQGNPVEFRYATSAPPNTVWANQVERMVKIANEYISGSVPVPTQTPTPVATPSPSPTPVQGQQ